MWRSRILYGFMLAAAVLLAVYFRQIQLPFVLLYMLLCIPVVSAVHIVWLRCRIRLEETLAETVIFRGDTVEYTLTLRSGALRSQVSMRFFSAPLLAYDCTAHTRGTQRYQIRCPWRGHYRLGVAQLTMTDCFGLFRLKVRPEQPLYVTVYPVPISGFRLSSPPGQEGLQDRRDLFREDPAVVSDIRAYQETDAIKRIHWKLSAKRGEMLVKVFPSPEPRRIVCLIDACTTDAPAAIQHALADRVVSCAYSACLAMLDLHCTITLDAGAAQRRTLSPADTPDSLCTYLALLSFDAAASPAAIALQALRRPQPPCDLFVFTAALTETLADLLLSALRSEHTVRLYCVPHAAESEALAEMLNQAGVEATFIPADDALPTQTERSAV